MNRSEMVIRLLIALTVTWLFVCAAWVLTEAALYWLLAPTPRPIFETIPTEGLGF